MRPVFQGHAADPWKGGRPFFRKAALYFTKLPPDRIYFGAKDLVPLDFNGGTSPESNMPLCGTEGPGFRN
jgi:hypothetical protein